MTPEPQVDPSVISHLRKIKALAEQGVGGERHVAMQKLRELLHKHGLNACDLLANVDRRPYVFRVSSALERKLLIQIAGKTTGVSTVKYSRNTRKVWLDLTPLEHADVLAQWQHFRPSYKKELASLAEKFSVAFFKQNGLLAPPDKGDEEPTQEEMDEWLSILAIASGIKGKPWIKPLAALTV